MNQLFDYGCAAVSTSTVIFSMRDKQLKLLLMMRASEPFKGNWALPGGLIQFDDDLDNAARRGLQTDTGISDVYLEQLYTFDAVNRSTRERIFTIAYYALISSDKILLQASNDAEAVGWFSMNNLPSLAYNHKKIVALAHQRLIAKLDYSTIAFQFMSNEFTLSELQSVYEIIRSEKIDRRNFRKWVLALELIEETGEECRLGAHRPAKLYRVINPDAVENIK